MKSRAPRRPVTILDVAKTAGVSFKTVSRVINGEPNVRQHMQDKVLRAVESLGYRPNVSARALAGSRSFMLALLGTDPSVGYMSALQAGAAAACREAGYHLIIEHGSSSTGRWPKLTKELLATQRLDGIILAVPAVDDDDVLVAIERSGIPYVRIAPSRNPDRSSRVEFDEERAAAQMTEYLWSIGHRHIGFVRGFPGHAASRLRQAGFEGALKRLGGEIRRSWIASGRFSFRSGVTAAEAILGSHERPTAIFASNDDMALGVISVATRLNLSVPRDLSVVGMDDLPPATFVWPELTTVRQPIREMGAAAVEILTTGHRGIGAPVARMLDYEIMIRGTASPPPQQNALPATGQSIPRRVRRRQ